MSTVSPKSFGLLIAYLAPGLTALWGASYFSETVAQWLGNPPETSATVGGFLYITVASIVAGLTVSTVRWAVIDKIHSLSGLPHPKWDFGKLQNNMNAFDTVVEHQYRYYQFYSNMVIALLFVLCAHIHATGLRTVGWAEFAIVVLIVIFFVGSRDTLRNYYERVRHILGTIPEPKVEDEGVIATAK